MSADGATRRATAEICWDGNPEAIAWAGSRPLHQCWPVLATYFRDVLLTPHRRAGENRVAWTWREPGDRRPPSSSELAALRQRLSAEQQLFADHIAGPGQEDDAGGLRSSANLLQVSRAMARAVADLVERSDAALAPYVCRTEAGLRVHSWGAATAGQVIYPDDRAAAEVSGRVVVDGQPAVWRDVFLAAADGGAVARIRTDDTGSFRFPEVMPGDYRLHAQAGRMRFPADGLAVKVGAEPVAGLLLQHPEPGARRAPGGLAAKRGRRIALAGLAAALAAGIVLWSRHEARPVAGSSAADATSSKVARAKAPETSSPKSSTVEASAAAKAAGGAAGVGVSGGSAGAGFDGGSARRAGDVSWEGRGVPAADSPVARPLAGGGASGSASGAMAEATVAGSAAHADSSSEVTGGHAGGGSDGGNPEKTNPSQGAPASGVAASAGQPAAGATTPPPAPPSGGATSPTTPTGAAATTPPSSRTVEDPRAQPVGPPGALHERMKVDPAGKLSAEPELTDPSLLAGASAEPAAVAAAIEPGNEAAADPSHRVRVRANESMVVAAAGLAASDMARIPAIERAAAHAGPVATLPAPKAFGRTIRARTTPWLHRMLTDRIVPTEPMPVSKAGSVQVLRDRLRQAQDAALPGSFRSPRFDGGVVIELPSASDAKLRWRDAYGASPAGASAGDGRGELRWLGLGPPQHAVYVLYREDGSPVARVEAGSTAAEWTLHTAEGVRARSWLGLVHDAAAGRFVWRAGSGAPLHSAGLASDERDGAVRVQVSLAHLASDALPLSLAVLDRETGWALVGGLEFKTESPAVPEIATRR